MIIVHAQKQGNRVRRVREAKNCVICVAQERGQGGRENTELVELGKADARRWYHIVENHDDLAGNYDEVLITVEDPDFILRRYGGAL
jgi:hypothetical protein